MGTELLSRWEFTAPDEAATVRLATLLAGVVEPGLVVCLDGPLGAGKTRLVRAFCEALGVPPAEVQSPTFVLVREYTGRLPVYHLDAYRLADEDELWALGVEEFFDAPAVTLVEWASRVRGCLPRERLDLTIQVLSPCRRHIRFNAQGDQAQRVLTALRDALAEGEAG